MSLRMSVFVTLSSTGKCQRAKNRPIEQIHVVTSCNVPQAISSLSLANWYLGGDRLVIQTSAMTAPLVGMQICCFCTSLPSSIVWCVAVQRQMAPLVIVELGEASQFLLQVASIPKQYKVKKLAPDSPDESFHKWMRNRQVRHGLHFCYVKYSMTGHPATEPE
jgi:hypothetical protein